MSFQEDDEIGNESYLSNVSSYDFNSNHALKYRTRRNRKTDLTEFYNLIYEYKNDCLKAAIIQQRILFRWRNKPNEEIFFYFNCSFTLLIHQAQDNEKTFFNTISNFLKFSFISHIHKFLLYQK